MVVVGMVDVAVVVVAAGASVVVAVRVVVVVVAGDAVLPVIAGLVVLEQAAKARESTMKKRDMVERVVLVGDGLRRPVAYLG